jgi:hypothetical protein
MSSEWMKVMLDEIAQKKAAAGQAQIELDRRRAEKEATPTPPSDDVAGAGRPARKRPDDSAQG